MEWGFREVQERVSGVEWGFGEVRVMVNEVTVKEWGWGFREVQEKLMER